MVKPAKTVRLRVSFECDCPWDPQVATWRQYVRNMKASVERMWGSDPIERLRVERVEKKRGKR